MTDDRRTEEFTDRALHRLRDRITSGAIAPPAAVMRTHADRWLRARRATGGLAAVAVVVAAIPAAVSLLPADGGGQSVGSPPVPGTNAPLPVLDCDVTELPLPDEYADPTAAFYPDVHLAAMDPTGRHVAGNGPYQRDAGGGWSDTDPNGMVLWEDGNPTAIPPLAGGASATGVSADGVLVGEGRQEIGGSLRYYAWIYRDGDMAELPAPEGYAWVTARAINAAGDVVGLGSRNEDGGWDSVVVWPAGDLDHPQVRTGPAEFVSPVWITDGGVVVAQLASDDGVYLWSLDGTEQELPRPEGATSVEVQGVRGHWLVANAIMPDAPQTESSATVPNPTESPQGPPGVAIRWDLRDLTFEVLEAVNSSVGSDLDVDANGNVLYSASTVIRDGDPYLLPDPIAEGAVTPPDADYTSLVLSKAISDDGSVVAGTVSIIDANSGTAAFHTMLWRC